MVKIRKFQGGRKSRSAFILMIIIFSVLFCLLNNYDISYDYILHPSDYVKVEGTVTGTYSRGRPKYYKHYADIEYEWDGKVRELTKVKRGLFEKTGSKAAVYVGTSSGRVIRGITLNYMDAAYVVILVLLFCRRKLL